MFWTTDIPLPINNRYSLQAFIGIDHDRCSKVDLWMPDNEQKDLIDKLICDPRIKNLL